MRNVKRGVRFCNRFFINLIMFDMNYLPLVSTTTFNPPSPQFVAYVIDVSTTIVDNNIYMRGIKI